MLTNTLKEHTQEAHLAVEKDIVQRLRSLRTMNDYASLLKLFYGYFGALETSIQRSIDPQKLPDLSSRRKTTSLLNDIHAIEGTAKPVIATDLPVIDSHHAALGALYVIEGSTLGGKIIGKMITRTLDDQPDIPLSFFNGYGELTDQKWNSFKTSVDDQCQTKEEMNITLSAALETFTKFKTWIERYEEIEKL